MPCFVGQAVPVTVTPECWLTPTPPWEPTALSVCLSLGAAALLGMLLADHQGHQCVPADL